MITAILLLFVCCRSLSYEFPESIPVYPVRVDVYTKKMVSSGHLFTLNSKLGLKDFKRRLQCSVDEPNFDFNSGSASLLRLIPPTREILELICAYGENRCPTWTKCLRERNYYLNNNSSAPERRQSLGYTIFQEFKLFRVMNGQFFYDWPWKVERFTHFHDGKPVEKNQIILLMKLVLDKVSDIPDSVFLAGNEQPSLPYNFPFPIFSFATSEQYSDMPWPWSEGLKVARSVYHNGSFTEDHRATLRKSRAQWKHKIPKAAFFGGYDDGRMMMFDAARRRPDLFDAAFHFSRYPISAWNPESKVAVLKYSDKNTFSEEQVRQEFSEEQIHHDTNAQASGFPLQLLNMSTRRSYKPSNYKYIVVPMGLYRQSTSGRLAGLLSTSGAVILLQRTSLVYHFSAQLKPWVHYVPLTYSGADLEEKVQWLRDHDDLARQIAENGRAFARSYLRLEDYYCYAAAALEMVGELEKGSDVLKPFNPRPLDPIYKEHQHVLNPVKMDRIGK